MLSVPQRPSSSGLLQFSDAHCHLQDKRLVAILDAVMTRAAAAGVTALMCCGTAEEDWQDVALLASTYAGGGVSFGVHPWYVADLSKDWCGMLREILQRHPDAGVGEIGLDWAIRDTDRDRQMAVFCQQLDLAIELNRPVSIHCRKAWGAVVEAIRHRGGLPAGGMMHSWSGSPEMVREFEKLGLYISFSGSITHSRNRKGHASVQAVSAERLLVETDCPDQAPAGLEDQPNEPASLRIVAEKVAELRGVSLSEIAAQTWENFHSLWDQPSSIDFSRSDETARGERRTSS